MTQLHKDIRQSLPWYARLILLAMGSGLVVLLGIAMYLEPSAKGYGTHMQLGLQPCTLTQIAGLRCPSCGMTTSWAHVVRGQFLQAVKANSGGTLLALIAVVAGPWMVLSAMRGRWFVRGPNEWVAVALAVIVVVVTLVDWGYRLSTTVM